jgi:hypothetical protein
MPCPYLAWTSTAEFQARWLNDLLLASGFQVILMNREPTATPKVNEWSEADSFYGVVAAEHSPDTTQLSCCPSRRFMVDLEEALKRNLPILVLVDTAVEVPREFESKWCEWWKVDFSDLKSLLFLTADIIRHTRKSKNVPSRRKLLRLTFVALSLRSLSIR